MKLNHFRELVAISEQGSIRAAARILEISQPTLTRSLADLERELGAPLFERRVRGVVATPFGQVFIDRARSILQDVRRACEEMRQLCGSTSGTVTVGLSVAAHLALLPSALRPFQRRYPDIKLHIIEGFYPTLELGLRRGEIDFYVGVDPGERVSSDFYRDVIAENLRTVLCRVDHPLANATSLAQLGSAEWATTSITAAAESELGAILGRHGLPPPKLCLRTQSALSLMTCIANSDLLAMVPVQWNEFAPTIGQLTTIPLRESLKAFPIVLIKRADLPLTPAGTYFLDLLRRGRLAPAQCTGPPIIHGLTGGSNKSTPRRRVAAKE